MSDADVIVVGGGPMGLIAALYARRAGLRATIVEPRNAPIDKACGEGLMPAGVAALAALGVHPAGRPLRGIRYVAGHRSAVADFCAGPGMGVRRTTLHTALVDAAEAAGADWVTAKVVAVSQDSGGVRLATATRTGAGPTLTSPYVVAADGLHSPMRHRLGLDRPRRGSAGTHQRHGLRRHFALPPWSDRVEVHWGATAELYVTPVTDDQVGVAALSRQIAPFDEMLRQFPAVAERLAGAAAGPVRGAAGLRQRSRRRTAGRILLIGDAAGYVDALTGEGIALGAAQARCAIDAVLARTPQAYEAAWHSVSRLPNALTHALVSTTRFGPGRRLIVPGAATFPGVFARVVDLIGSPHPSPEPPPDAIPLAPNGIAKVTHD